MPRQRRMVSTPASQNSNCAVFHRQFGSKSNYWMPGRWSGGCNSHQDRNCTYARNKRLIFSILKDIANKTPSQTSNIWEKLYPREAERTIMSIALSTHFSLQ